MDSSNHARIRLLKVKAGDVIFSFSAKGFQAVLVARSDAPKNNTVCVIPCDYYLLDDQITVEDVLLNLGEYLQGLYSPINSNGKRNNGYLFPISVDAGRELLEISQCSLNFELFDNEVEQVAAPRKLGLINRVVRDSKIAREVKGLYGSICQVCQVALITPKGNYAEGAHIIPLGEPHNGADTTANLLCLCPNHHALFDNFAFSIGNGGRLIGEKGRIFVHPEHQLSKGSLDWHLSMYIDVATLKRK